jgi:predicted nucleotidyltransferase
VARHAILDDNQAILERRIARLSSRLPELVGIRVVAAMVIGSVAEGRAGDQSDIDLLLVLREGAPARADYRWWDERVAASLPDRDDARFPVEPLFVGRSALRTNEPHLRNALRSGLPVWDPEGLFA